MLFLCQIMLILVVTVEVYLVLSLIQTYFYDDLQPKNILVEQMYKDDVIYDKYFPIFIFVKRREKRREEREKRERGREKKQRKYITKTRQYLVLHAVTAGSDSSSLSLSLSFSSLSVIIDHKQQQLYSNSLVWSY